MSASAAEVGCHVICADGWRVIMHVEVRRGPYKGQMVSARDLPTGCQQRCSLVVPTVRAARHLTEPSASKLALVWCGQIVVRSCQVVARAFAFIWSNSAWVIVPASRSCLADAI